MKTATERFTELSASIKEKEKQLAEIQVLKKHIFDYFKTKDVYADYRKCGYSKKFLEEHRQDILLHKAAKEYLKDQILRFANNKAFVEKIKPEEQRDGDVLLITGVGEVFPFARVHALLEAIQPEVPNIPILVMYPGSFNGRQLRLFDKLEPNGYYRAFNAI